MSGPIELTDAELAELMLGALAKMVELEAFPVYVASTERRDQHSFVFTTRSGIRYAVSLELETDS